jgi:hypothetical protein
MPARKSRRLIVLHRFPIVRASLALAVVLGLGAPGRTLADSAAADASARAAVTHLAGVMDEFHERFPVYDDVSSAGNHFHAWSKIPDETAAVDINGSWVDNPHAGATTIRCEFRSTTGSNFGGFYFLNGVLPAGAKAPAPNFGEVAEAGIDLSGATALTFWVRGARGGEEVEFFMGGVGRDLTTGAPTKDAPDSSPRVPPPGTPMTLTTAWTQVTIDLHGRDLHYVLGGFGWVVSATKNPQGAVFFLDDIQYELDDAARRARLEAPRLVRSFVTEASQGRPEPVGEFDLVLRNVAFTYDNALAILAFLADGSDDGLRRARLVGDALVYAAEHDRTFDDGRLRDAYAAGDRALPPGWTPNGRKGTVPVPGFYDEPAAEFVEVEQAGMSTGNQAWAMIALLTLHRWTQEPRYLDAAMRLGSFIRTLRNDTGTYQGFLGGLDDPEGNARRRPWASTEHNLDVHAAFSVLAGVTGDESWRADAEHARRFVEAMWEAERGCFLAGTSDQETRNAAPGRLPVDAQPWVALAVPGALDQHPDLLVCPERHHAAEDSGFTGFDFNDDRDGVWFEGTAHVAVARAFTGDDTGAEVLRTELRRAQQTLGNGRGIVAAAHDGVSTGFDTSANTPFRWFRRLHVGATAWLAFAQRGFNPFYATTAGPCDDADACTRDVPYPTGGCAHPLVVGDVTIRLTCRIENLGPLMRHPARPCRRRCWRQLRRRLEKIGRLVLRAPKKSARRCRRRVGQAARLAEQLASRLDTLVRRGRLDPPERAERVRAETERLVDGFRDAAQELCGA